MITTNKRLVINHNRIDDETGDRATAGSTATVAARTAPHQRWWSGRRVAEDGTVLWQLHGSCGREAADVDSGEEIRQDRMVTEWMGLDGWSKVNRWLIMVVNG